MGRIDLLLSVDDYRYGAGVPDSMQRDGAIIRRRKRFWSAVLALLGFTGFVVLSATQNLELGIPPAARMALGLPSACAPGSAFLLAIRPRGYRVLVNAALFLVSLALIGAAVAYLTP